MAKILFIDDLNQYGRGYQRLMNLKGLGHEVDALSHTYISKPGEVWRPSFMFRVFWKLKVPLDSEKVNDQIIDLIQKKNYDFIWIEKGNMMKPWILAKIKKLAPKAKLIASSEDDMYVSHGRSNWYRWGLRFYDAVFTTKAYNVAELEKEFGAKKVTLFLDSYSEFVHRPFELTAEEKEKYSCDISAIGAFEPERAASLLYLAENGLKVQVWGGLWAHWVGKHPNLVIHNKFLFGQEYSKAICATKINLNFLRKINRDEVTSRSVEIPACGGFMLTERTGRHSQFFKEGVEADFFSTNEELLEKVRFYLKNDALRKQIAQAGYQRCLKDYSMKSQLQFIMDKATG